MAAAKKARVESPATPVSSLQGLFSLKVNENKTISFVYMQKKTKKISNTWMHSGESNT